MRIHEVEIYTSKQIRAFIKYLEVVADEKQAIEEMQSHYSNANMLAQANCIGSQISGFGTAATPEYMAKLRAEAASQQTAEKAEVQSTAAGDK